MSVDFFDTDCKEPVLTHQEFGLCDDEDGSKAYTNIDNPNKWIARVNNEAKIEVTFTAIDNCIEIYKDGTQDKESLCDGMLRFEKSVFLVELKNQGTGGWLSKAISQLKNTINHLKENNSLEGIRFKKAYACNKKHPFFTVINVERKRKFYDETSFRIDAQAKIVIK